MADNKKNSKNNKPGMIIYKEGKLYNSIKEMERKAIEEIAASRETDTTDNTDLTIKAARLMKMMNLILQEMEEVDITDTGESKFEEADKVDGKD